MLTNPRPVSQKPDFEAQRRSDRSTLRLWHLCCWFGVVAVAGLALVQNERFSLASVVLLIVLVTAVVRPLVGLYLTVFFTALGDPSITGWYPFTKNLSSAESILYVNDRLIVSPVELALLAIVFGWMLRMWAESDWTIVRGKLCAPLMVFSGFVVLGLAYGLATGGNLNVALWEARALLYLPVVYLLVSNLSGGERKNHERLWFSVIAGVLLNGVAALSHLRELSPERRLDLESLITHSAAVPMNAVFIMILAAWLFRPSPAAVRVILPVLAIPTLVAYLVSERRVAIAGLFVSLALVGVALWWTRRRAFWVIAPVFLVLAVGYLGVFWNASGPLAAPALAAKTIIAPDQLSEKDRTSDLYRQLENANVTYTIQNSPLLGVGFGHPFLQPYALPNISPFLLAQYVSHNSILWIWLKVGFGGFVAFLYLMAMTMRRAAQACLRTAGTGGQYIAVTAAAFVVSYLVFTYGDIAWDATNMVVLGLALAHLDAAAGSHPTPRDDGAATALPAEPQHRTRLLHTRGHQ